MKHKMLLISLAAVLALSLGIVGCTGEGPVEPELYLTFSDHNPGGPGFNPIATAMQDYAAYIEDNSDGKVEITCHYLGSLYANVELFDAVKGGACDGGSYAPEIGDGMYYNQVMSLPFMGWPSRADAENIYWELSANTSEIPGEFTAQNCTMATYFMMPEIHFHFYDPGVVVDEPADCDGLGMIILEGIYNDILAPLNITCYQMGFPDLVPSFQTHVGDGYVQHSEFLWGALGKEYFDSHTLFEGGILIMPMGHLWNKNSYDDCLAIVGQTVMDEAKAIYLNRCTLGSAVDTAAIYQYFIDEGHTVTSLNATQTEAFKTLLLDYHDDWIDGAPVPATAQAIYDTVVAAIAALP